RLGGVSTGIYHSLNCGTHSGDDGQNIAKNRLIASSTLLPGAALAEIHQTHSNKVHIFNGDIRTVDADAIVTNEKNVALSIVTADCAPVLFVDQFAAVIGAAHAGWKGARNGIIHNTIEAMCELGADRQNIVAAIGPCIAQKSYEVGDDLYKQIDNDSYFLPATRAGHYQFDLESYVFDRIWQNEVTKIDALGIDTYPYANNFFSYRRKTHLDEPDYGRQISIIVQH
ncbi:MAG TPA: peptidoglycan editing factor PgeF, partial [Emcibacteraceae bacterium]|nr:peptidoglycan editing factor PgeF [Emcibacteraceae bacterium]